MKTALRRTLSVMLTVVMLVSCWVFTAPTKTTAQSAGNYSVTFTYDVKDQVDKKNI